MSNKYNLGAVQQGITKTVLWDNGAMVNVGNYTLNDSVFNYKIITIEHEYQNTYIAENVFTNLLPGDSKRYVVSHGNADVNACTIFSISSDGTIVNVIACSDETIVRIIGFK